MNQTGPKPTSAPIRRRRRALNPVAKPLDQTQASKKATGSDCRPEMKVIAHLCCRSASENAQAPMACAAAT